MNRIFSALVASCLCAGAVADENRRLSAEVLWELERVGAPIIDPDGRHVVVPVTTYPEDGDESVTRLWLLTTRGEPAQRPLTIDGAKASDSVFSPDGSKLAFVSKRGEDEGGQIYVLPMDGPGEAARLTDIPTGAASLKWVGDQIYFVSNVWPDKTFEEMAEAIEAKEESKLSAKVWNAMPYSHWDHWIDEERQNHLFRVPASGGEIEPLTLPTGLQLPRSEAGTEDFDVSPDGRMLAFVANSRSGGVYPDLDVYLWTPGSGEPKNLTEQNEAPDGYPLFAPDGRKLAFLRQTIAGFYGDQARLMIHDLASGSTREVHEGWDRSAEGLVWAPDSTGMYGAIDDAGTRRVYFLPLGGNPPLRITDGTNFDSLNVSKDGTLVARNQSFIYPPRVQRVDTRDGSLSRLDRFNDEQLADVDLGSYESVNYTGADGKEIQMWINYPPGFDDSDEYPLYLLIHGGPHGAVTDMFHFRWNAQTFSSWGYVTAWPNFHGSSGFGQAFTDSINPDWATRPYADVIAAAGWLADQPWIDSERMVAGGGSYGGYLSSIILGREHPFNALVIHAAVYDLYAQTSADFAVHDRRFGPYWEKPEIYREISPHYYAAGFKTPSLVIHGQNDLRVPVGQAFELFRALQTHGVQSRLVYYPDENHWVLTRANSLHWYGEVRDWVEKFAGPGPR
jgi:dipeptidyl aminopeptidase/acylaminoacyl peptidase